MSFRLSHLALLAAVMLIAEGPSSASSPEAIELTGDRLMSAGRAENLLKRYGITVELPVDPPTADDASYYLQYQLVREGYPEARVTYSITPSGRLILDVSRGQRQRIGEISYDGVDVVPDVQDSDIFLSSLRQATLTPFGRVPYVERGVNAAAASLQQYYVNDGFLDAAVSVDTKQDPAKARTIDLQVHITPGPQYHIVGLEVSGLPEEFSEPEVVGQVYRPGDEVSLRAKVRNELRDHGYFAAKVTQAVEPGGENGVTIRLNVQPGEKARLAEVKVSGVQKTRGADLKRRLGLKDGVLYDAEAVHAGIRRLWSSGAFERIDVEAVPAGSGEVVLDVDVAEAPARQIGVTAGYGQWERAFAEVTFSDLNFLGTLNRLEITGVISERTFGGLVLLADPWLMNRDLEGNVSVFAIRQEVPAFRATSFGGGFALVRRFDTRMETGWQAEIGWQRVTDTTIFADNSFAQSLTDYTMGHVGFSQTLDRRNDPFVPLSGYFLYYDTDLASRYLVGDVSFFRALGQATWYLPVRRITQENPFVPFFVLNHRAGAILPFDGTGQVPIQERFFLGGTNTVRSFQFDGMAPRAPDGSPLGGQMFLQANVECQMPIIGSLYVLTFLDAGNLASDFDSFSWDETRFAVGLGSRFDTPLGSVSLDYGYNLVRKNGDPIGAWQFGFGFTF